MINILTKQKRHELKIETRLRFAAVTLLIVSVVLVAVTVLLVPVYKTARDQEKSMARYVGLEKDVRSNARKDSSIKTARITTAQIKAAQKNQPFGIAELIERVVSEWESFSDVIVITSFEYVFDKENNTNVLGVSGVAGNVAVLGEFTTALQRTNIFSGVTLPVSNLADGKDEFSLKLVPQIKK